MHQWRSPGGGKGGRGGGGGGGGMSEHEEVSGLRNIERRNVM